MRSIHSQLFKKHENILHAFSTKQNGHSKPPFSQNNLAYHVNDNLLDVQENHLHYAQYLNYDIKKLVYMDQVHGDSIHIITQHSDLSQIPSCDALITQEKNIPLMVMVADCIPILIYDPIHQVIAVVHAGRAGIFKKLIPKTIQTMQESYHSKPSDIIIVLGPSIRQCCYEVGIEIYNEAKALSYEYALQIKGKHYYLDLISIAKQQLAEIKVNKNNIDILDYCTACHHNLFFSYRAEENNTGRFSGLIMLK